jgi:hypothetical protein
MSCHFLPLFHPRAASRSTDASRSLQGAYIYRQAQAKVKIRPGSIACEAKDPEMLRIIFFVFKDNIYLRHLAGCCARCDLHCLVATLSRRYDATDTLSDQVMCRVTSNLGK